MAIYTSNNIYKKIFLDGSVFESVVNMSSFVMFSSCRFIETTMREGGL
jgi:hypothetical protein